MSRGESADGAEKRRLLEAWAPPSGAGDPLGLLATTFTFDAGFFEEELLARFLAMESSVVDGRAYLVEREERLGGVPVTVLVDRRHISRSTTLAWDLLPVPLRSGCQHAKVSVLAWNDLVRVIVASANLTEPAYRRNLECFSVLDFRRSTANPSSPPFGVLDAFLGFLRRMVARVPDPGEPAARNGSLLESERGEPAREGIPDSPCGRARALLDAVARIARGFGLPEAWPRGEVQTFPVFLEPDRGNGVLEAMDEIWNARPRPDEAWILSPFWSTSDDPAHDSVVETIISRLTNRGRATVRVFAAGAEDTATGRWSMEAPESLRAAAARFPRISLDLRPVVARVEGETRPLHAKAIQWARGLEQRILLIGSSNASPSGLGLPGTPRNIEANLCFLARKDRSTSRCFDACFPSAPAIAGDRVSLEGSPIRADEEGGPLPVPAFFRWAAVDRSRDALELRLGLGGGPEPSWWYLATDDDSFELDRERFARHGRPPVWDARLPGDPSKSPPPSLIEIRWRSSEVECRGSLPVNALNGESRSRPDLWSDIDLDTLLALLASSGPVYRRLARIIGRGNGKQGRGGVPVERDPLRRVDTSNFLMQRIRRVSLAIEGLKERLRAPVSTGAALEWRFHGPLSPAFLARRLLDATEDSEERRFLVAEIALAVGNAARAASCPGIPAERVQARYAEALRELASLVPPGDEDSRAGKYLVEVLMTVQR